MRKSSLFALLLYCLTLPIRAQTARTADPPVNRGWLDLVQENIATEEYGVTWQDRTVLGDLPGAWHAPNRAHGFRTYFTDAGPRVVPRTEGASTWEWGLSLVGYGRGGRSRALPDASLRAEGQRIDYERGVVTEWYENSPRGLKQGFVLSAMPEEDENGPASSELPLRDRPVHLDLRLVGTLEPSISSDGQAVDFRTGRGVNVIHYAELGVTDAAGRELPAWIEGFAGEGFGGLRIVFEDDGAAYPVTVDPLATTAAWTAESDQANAHFGCSVATAGDVDGDGHSDVIVGAKGYDNGEAEEGRAFVYHGSPSGLATTAGWTAEGDQASASFGFAVAPAGDVNGDGYADIIVGAWGRDSVYVYHGSSTGLSAVATWTEASDQAGAQFGYSVGPAGDVNGDGYADVIVGANTYDNGQSNEGRAFVYHGSAAGLAPPAVWTAESNQADASFGQSVSTAGDVNGDGYSDVVVGASSYTNGQNAEGRAYVYHGSATGLVAAASRTVESNQISAQFGRAVAAAGDVNGDGYADVIVGAPQYVNGQMGEGRAYVYHGSATGLAAAAAWTAEGNQTTAFFGYSLATAGDVNGDGYADVIVGATWYANGETQEGRAFVYQGSSVGLATTAAWTAEGNDVGVQFGFSVATAGDVNGDGYSDVIVGAESYSNGQGVEGRAYLFSGSAAGLAVAAGWTAESNLASVSYGHSVATAGDVNGDGYSDVIVGAYLYDGGQTDEGRAYVYAGSATGLATTAAWTAESNLASANFGYSVATAGDVDGDGYSDVIVGAHRYGNGQSSEGRAYAYLGGASGLGTTPVWTAESDQAVANFGYSVGTAGDVNGDGHADVIVGAYRYDGSVGDTGRAYVYLGSVTGLGAAPAWTAEGDMGAALLGRSVGTAGDVNGDGYADVIVGAWNFAGGQTFEGRAYAYLGSTFGLAVTPAWTAQTGQPGAEFGISVGTAGDVNGDGYSDVIVGAYEYDNVESGEGSAYVYLGSIAGLGATPAWTAEGNHSGARFGVSVGTAGDVNGDGYSDVVVGANLYDNGQTDEGRAFVYHGSASGPAPTAAWSAESDQASADFGYSVATAGDVNGDGYSDVIVGARLYNGGQTDEGRAFLYYGNSEPSLALRPQQRRADDIAPVVPIGLTGDPDRVRLAALGRTPFGRAPVKLEWEVKPLGTAFDGTGTSAGASWSDTGLSGIALNEQVTGLAADPVHHWRARLRYHPAAVPFATASRWLTPPANGWQEADFRTDDESCAGTNADGDGVDACSDCDDADPDCSTDCADSDADGLCGDIDCRDDLATCMTDCSRVFVTPFDGTVGVATLANIRAEFCSVVAPATVTPASFVVQDCSETPVAGELDLSHGDRRVTFDPTGPLAGGTRYFVSLTSAIEILPDTPITPSDLSFTTGPDSASAPIDSSELGQTLPGTALVEGTEQAEWGRASAIVGDVNGDGIDDLAIGAPATNDNGTDSGSITLVLGGPALATGGDAARIVFRGEAAGDHAGFTVAAAGDVNSDERADVLIGAPGNDAGGIGAGRAYVVFGSASWSDGMTFELAQVGGTLAGVRIDGTVSGEQIGFAISGNADANEDGEIDLILGAPFADPGGRTDAGKVYLLFGPPAGASLALGNVGGSVPGVVYEGIQAGDEAGYAADLWRDNGGPYGDGLDDVLIGSPGYDPPGFPGGGRIYIINDHDFSSSPVVLSRVNNGLADEVTGGLIAGEQAGLRLGVSLIGFDASSFADGTKLLAGAGGCTPGPGGNGLNQAVVVWTDAGSDLGFVRYEGLKRGGGTSSSNSEMTPITKPLPGPCPAARSSLGPGTDFVLPSDFEFGQALAVLGDADGAPGFEIAVGLASDAAAGNPGAGRVVVVGGAALVPGTTVDLDTVGVSTPGVALEGAEANDGFGWSVAGGGDVNGDGLLDLVAGAPMVDVPDPGQPGMVLPDAGSAVIASFAVPAEAVPVNSVFDLGGNGLEWEPTPGATHYNVYRGLLSTLRASGRVRTSQMTCIAGDTAQDVDLDGRPDLVDPVQPDAGTGFYYLVTAGNRFGDGGLGVDSQGLERVNDAPCSAVVLRAIPGPDPDGDARNGLCDNCPDVANANQSDLDDDGAGDVCDACPADPLNDYDADGVCGDDDNCPTVPNAMQTDSDFDGVGDACE